MTITTRNLHVQFERRTEVSTTARLLQPDCPETGFEEIIGDVLEADLNEAACGRRFDTKNTEVVPVVRKMK